MSIYICNECNDKAYRRLSMALNEFMKELDKRIKDCTSEQAKFAMMSVADDLERLIKRN